MQFIRKRDAASALLLARFVQPMRDWMWGVAGGGAIVSAEGRGSSGVRMEVPQGRRGGKVTEQSPLVARDGDADEEEGKCCVVQ